MEQLYCPVTGLTVYTRPEWTNRQLSETFVGNFYIIGNSIIYSRPEGKADLEGVSRSTDLKKEVAQYMSDGTGPYIQIQDYTVLQGSTPAGRSSFIKDADEDERLTSMIFCNLSPIFSLAVNIGNRFNTSGKYIHRARHYAEAIQKAVGICEKGNYKLESATLDPSIRIHNPDNSLKPLHIISDDAWNVETPEFTNRVVIIDRNILLSRSEGYFTEEHVTPIDRSFDLCYAALPEAGCIHNVVVDASGLKGSSRAGRLKYMQMVKERHRKCPIRVYIMYGVNTFLRTAIHMARPLMPFNLRIARDFNEAFTIVKDSADEISLSRQTERETINARKIRYEDIQKLLAFVGNIEWEQEGIDRNFDVDETHPFYILYQSISLLKEEVDSLFADREKVMDDLEKSNAQLQDALSELKQAQERIVQQERLSAVGQLAAGIAHDFNNILTSILGCTELLQTSPDMPPVTQEHLEQISASSKRAANMVGQLLDFSRKSIHQPRQFDLSIFIKESVKFIKRTIPENIRINLDVTPGEYLIEADPTQMQQIITNLAVNARDAMVHGGDLGIELSRVECRNGLKCAVCSKPIEGEWLRLKISDTGGGISAEEVTRIFEPFFTTKEIGKGTGLGLSQVTGIVEKHGGHIDVESRPGQGTTFAVYLLPTEGESITVESGPTDMIAGRGETILVVEDDPSVLGTTKAMLEKLGYRVLPAVSGEDGLLLYDKHKDRIAAVLSDVVMPDMDGELLLRRLKTDNYALAVVMMSGYPLGKREEMFMEQGVVDWFQKPVTLKKLSRVMGRALSKEEGRWSYE